ncbi:hypothetical protein C2E23DRAFT_332440 [Lenzites betulinus]|nr:hypothetical protein C2E23DRAFT_332440 [Lenzites betulinus]
MAQLNIAREHSIAQPHPAPEGLEEGEKPASLEQSQKTHLNSPHTSSHIPGISDGWIPGFIALWLSALVFARAPPGLPQASPARSFGRVRRRTLSQNSRRRTQTQNTCAGPAPAPRAHPIGPSGSHEARARNSAALQAFGASSTVVSSCPGTSLWGLVRGVSVSALRVQASIFRASPSGARRRRRSARTRAQMRRDANAPLLESGDDDPLCRPGARRLSNQSSTFNHCQLRPRLLAGGWPFDDILMRCNFAGATTG